MSIVPIYSATACDIRQPLKDKKSNSLRQRRQRCMTTLFVTRGTATAAAVATVARR